MRRGFDLDKVEPNYFCTRIWIGVVPPEDIDGQYVPGYACVVGEKFDGDPMQREREMVVLDEGIALDPADFTPEDQKYYGIRKDSLDHPTLYTLRGAVIGLKDLYRAGRVICPPGNPQFFNFIRQTDGLYGYGNYGDSRYARHMPFFVARSRVCDSVLEAEHEQRAHNLELVNSLLAMDRLKILTDCKLFWDRRLPTAHRAIGLICAEMQMSDMTYQIRKMSISDGYDAYEENSEEREHKQEVMKSAEDLAWLLHGGQPAGGSQWLK